MQPESQDLNSLSAVPAETPAQPNVVKKLFVGPHGLRAFWRLLIFVAIIFALEFALRHVVRSPATPQFTAIMVLKQDGLGILVIVIATKIMGVFEKRSFATYGLPARGAFGPLFMEGLLWGFAAESATMLTLYFTGNAGFHGLDQHGILALKYGAAWAFAFLAVGFFEEFFFRGYPQFTLSTGIGFWPSAFIISGLFWFAHMGNPGETWVGGLATALAAMIFCVSLWFTGNLWFAIGMHASWDWTETYFFGVPDSGMPANGHLLNSTLSGSKWMTGGTVGPEGSVVELAVTLAVIALLWVRFRHRAPSSYRTELSNLRDIGHGEDINSGLGPRPD